jgi:transcription termination factor Rho
MSIISTDDLEASPLADLHALAGALGVDGFRGLRKADLVEAIVARQGGSDAPSSDGGTDGESAPSRSGRSRRRRGRSREGGEGEAASGERRSGGREPAAAGSSRGERAASGRGAEVSWNVEGVVELLANGSGFVLAQSGDGAARGGGQGEGDVYISAAQARRCELVNGDRVSGPARPARRSERHPSLIRIDAINGVPADEAVRGTRVEDIAADWPTQLLAFGSDDALLGRIEQVAPFGRGSRVVISGPPRSGKSVVIGKLAAALAPVDGLSVELLGVGVRPEELSELAGIEYASGGNAHFGVSADAQDAIVEQAVERGRRIAVRGGDAVLLIDTLDGLAPNAARRALSAARNLRDAGSLTVIATAREPLGGETTVIALEPAAPAPALDSTRSGTTRGELLAAPSASKPKPKRATAAKPRAPRKPVVKKTAGGESEGGEA